MKKLSLCFALTLSSGAFASQGFLILSSVGETYQLVDGKKCGIYMDIMKWGNFEDMGTVSFAETDAFKARPLQYYKRLATISAKNLLPMGDGVFTYEFNQSTPIKAEYELAGENVTIFAHNKGKGSGLFGNGDGYKGTNQKFSYRFSRLNGEGIFQDLATSYQNMKGIFNGKKQECQYRLKR